MLCYACNSEDIEVESGWIFGGTTIAWKLCHGCGIVWVDDAYFKANARVWRDQWRNSALIPEPDR